jgi:glycosyltransferase involved in cell wall biosynthesis
MKFSVLLPTRNRLQFLKFAIETVRRQDYADWEIVVSDNNSEDDIGGYVASCADARIRYQRSDRFLPVTENWNYALAQSRGDYVIMLGDDDGLMPGYFRAMTQLVTEFDRPELIYTSGYLFAYPGVLPDHPNGLLNHYRNGGFFDGAQHAFRLEARTARRVALDAMNFKMTFGFNMQYSLISRSLIDRLRPLGPFFQSPFPDYYATIVMFLKARQIVVEPRPLVAIGITPKSYGFYLFNDRESEGVEFLNSLADDELPEQTRRILLPGTNMNTSWLLAMETVARNLGGEMPLRVNHRRYRLLQALTVLRASYRMPERSRNDVQQLRARLAWHERLLFNGMLAGLAVTLRVAGRRPRAAIRALVRRATRRLRGSLEWQPTTSAQPLKTMLDVYEAQTAAR